MRLDKFLVSLSYGSRSDIKKACKAGLIKVNSNVATSSDIHIDPSVDEIRYDGNIVFYKENLTLLVNKEQNYICSNIDEDYPSVLNLLPDIYRRFNLNFAGRLDYDTTGLVILSTDGELIHKIISPKSNVYKTYLVELENKIANPAILTKPMRLSDFHGGFYETEKSYVEVIDDKHLYLSIKEGKFHQVKEMVANAGSSVVSLQRVKIGKLSIDELEGKSYLELNEEQIERIFG